MHIFNVNVQTKDFASDGKVPEFYAKQLTSLALRFTNADGTPYALSVDDMIYFVADTDFNPNTAPAIPKTYAAPADIYPDDGLVVFFINTNTPRYRTAINCKGTCLNAEVRIQRGQSWEPILFSRVLGHPMVVDPDAPPEPAPLIEWVQTVNGLVGHVDILDADGVPYPVDTATNSITIQGGQDYISGTGIDITDATVSVTSDVAFKSDITSSVQAHNESITSHADIRIQLNAKADTVDVVYALDNKVDKDGDKVLSDNNFSDADKNKVDSLGSMSTETASDYRKKTDQDAIDNGKVDKNQPITAATSTKVTYDANGLILSGTSLAEADIPEISQSKVNGLLDALNGKVDKVEGKGLSTNDYGNDDKSKVDALGSMAAEDTEDYRTAAEQDLIDAGKVNSNAAITGATKTKITYDSKGLVTAGADLEESDIPNISASKVTGLATVATSGSYNDISNKPLDRETVPMSITGYAVEGYPVARLDDVYDAIEIYKNAVGLAVVEMTVRSADNTITGNIILIPVINSVDGDPVTIAVTASWAKVSFALEIPAGTLAFRRDHASASDTLKDGASVITAQVIEITYRSSVL